VVSLTPLEIENVLFRRSMFGGYDRTDVERFLAQAARSIDEYVTRIDQLQRQLEQQELDLARYRESEEHLKHSVVLAQRTADELIAAARQRAETIRGEATLEADRLRHSLVDLHNEREQFEFAFHGLLSGFMRRLESNNPALAGSTAGNAAPQALPPPTAAPTVASAALDNKQVPPSPPPAAASLQEDASRASAGSMESATEKDPDAADFARALSAGSS
jgi:DivIVA domain-containing protein